MEITVLSNNQKFSIPFNQGDKIYSVLVRGGFRIDAPCGGKGRCNKCLVEADGEMVYACKTLAHNGMVVRLFDEGNLQVLTDTTPVSVTPQGEGYGVAVDMGTTTVAAQLYDLETGEVKGTYARANNQKSYGSDVISRSEHSEDVHPIAIKQLNEILDYFGVKVDKLYIAGNTIMQHFTLGLDARPITVAPFTPATTALEVRSGAELGINADEVKVLPCISGYVGADIVMGILATGIHKAEKPCILLDIGTNGEIVIGSRDGIYCCSAAAGPAFEGAGISCGMSGIDGAVKSIKIENDVITYQTIGDKPPQGICGSGILDVVAEFLKSGIIDETGYLEDDVIICDNVTITPKDIREVQLAKAAIGAGIYTLLKKTGISLDDIDALYLAGGFGNYLDKNSAATIGLIPDELCGKVKTVGNTSLTGCVMAMLDNSYEDEGVKIAEQAHYIELSCDGDFQSEYIEQMMFQKGSNE